MRCDNQWRQRVPAAHRGAVGICLPCGHRHCEWVGLVQREVLHEHSRRRSDRPGFRCKLHVPRRELFRAAGLPTYHFPWQRPSLRSSAWLSCGMKLAKWKIKLLSAFLLPQLSNNGLGVFVALLRLWWTGFPVGRYYQQAEIYRSTPTTLKF